MRGLKRAMWSIFCLVAISASASNPDWPAVRAELESLHASDQALRNEMTARMAASRQGKEKFDVHDQQALWRKIHEQDQANQGRLDEIVAKAGWPGQKDVGDKASLTAWLIVQHGNTAYRMKYIDQLRKAAEQGQLSPSRLALTEDRMLVEQSKPQRYGSQFKIDGGIDLFPVEDPDKLDAWRKEVGLNPICQHLQTMTERFGPIKYPPCVK